MKYTSSNKICTQSVKERKKINDTLADNADKFGNWLHQKGFEDMDMKGMFWQQVKDRTIGRDAGWEIKHLQKLPKIIETAKKNIIKEKSGLWEGLVLPEEYAKDWAPVEVFNDGIFNSVNRFKGIVQRMNSSMLEFFSQVRDGGIKLGAMERNNPLRKIYKNERTLAKVLNQMLTEYDTATLNGDSHLARELYEGNIKKNIVGIREVLSRGQGKIFKEIHDLMMAPKRTVTKDGKTTLSYEKLAKKLRYTDAAINAAKIWHDDLAPIAQREIFLGLKHFRNTIKDKRHLFGDLVDRKGRPLYDQVIKNFDKTVAKFHDGEVQKDGFFPILTMDVLPSLSEASALIFHPKKGQRIKDLKKGAGIIDKLKDVFDENRRIHLKLRNKEVSDNISSANIIPIVDAYVKNAARFNMVTYNSGNYLKIMSQLHKLEGGPLEGKLRQMERFIDHQYSIISGQKGAENRQLTQITRAITSYQFASKLGLNFRSWARNATQSLLNYVHFGAINLKRSYELMRNSKMQSRVQEGLADNGILFANYREVHLQDFMPDAQWNAERGIMEQKIDGTYLSKIAEGIDRVAEFTGFGMQYIENNLNRRLTYQIGFSLAWKNMKDESIYNEKLFESNISRLLKDEGITSKRERANLIKNDYAELKTSGTHTIFKKNDASHYKSLYENWRRERANNAGIWAVKELHFDYSATGKSRWLTTKPGAIMFQFKHYSFSYYNYQRKIARDYLEDMSAGMWNTDAGRRAFRLANLYGVLLPLFEIGVPGGAKFGNLVQNDTIEQVKELRDAILEGVGAKEKRRDELTRGMRGSFYDKGPVVGLLGGPMGSDLVTLNNLADIYDMDDDSTLAWLTGYQDLSHKSTNEKWRDFRYLIQRGGSRLIDGFFGYTGNAGTWVQKEFALFPDKTIRDRRKRVGNWFRNKLGMPTKPTKKQEKSEGRVVPYGVDSSLNRLESEAGGKRVIPY